MPGDLAAPAVVRDQLGVERPLGRALHHQEIALRVADIERGELRPVAEQLLGEPFQERPPGSREAAGGSHAGQRAHGPRGRVQVALDLSLDALIEGCDQVVRQRERIVAVGAVGVERDRDDRADDQGHAGERHAEAGHPSPARAPQLRGIGIDVDDLVGAHLGNPRPPPDSFCGAPSRRAILPQLSAEQRAGKG